jgi:hypothetical protein
LIILGIVCALVAYVICCAYAYRAGVRKESGKEVGWVVGGVPIAAVAFFIPWVIALALVVVVVFVGLTLIGTVLNGGSGSGGVISTAIRRQQRRDDIEAGVHNALVRDDARHYWENR